MKTPRGYEDRYITDSVHSTELRMAKFITITGRLLLHLRLGLWAIFITFTGDFITFTGDFITFTGEFLLISRKREAFSSSVHPSFSEFYSLSITFMPHIFTFFLLSHIKKSSGVIDVARLSCYIIGFIQVICYIYCYERSSLIYAPYDWIFGYLLYFTGEFYYIYRYG